MFFITIKKLVIFQRFVAIIYFVAATVSVLFTESQISDCNTYPLIDCNNHWIFALCPIRLEKCKTIEYDVQIAIDRYDRNNNYFGWYLYSMVFIYISIDLLWYFFKFPTVVHTKNKNREWLKKILIDYKYVDTVTQNLRLIYCYIIFTVIQIIITIDYLVQPDNINLFPSVIDCRTIDWIKIDCNLKFNIYYMIIYSMIWFLNFISLSILIICLFQIVMFYLSADFRLKRIRQILYLEHNDSLLKNIAKNCELFFCLECLITDLRLKFLIQHLGTDFWLNFVSEFNRDEKIYLNA